MTESRKPLYPNPFYVVLVFSSTALAITMFAWLVVPYIQERAAQGKGGAGSLALANWIDRNSVWLLTIELALIVISGIMAMVSDQWFRSKKGEGS